MQIEGRDYSFMDKFAEYGFDVWTLDHEGYGRSTRTSSNSNIAMLDSGKIFSPFCGRLFRSRTALGDSGTRWSR